MEKVVGIGGGGGADEGKSGYTASNERDEQ